MNKFEIVLKVISTIFLGLITIALFRLTSILGTILEHLANLINVLGGS